MVNNAKRFVLLLVSGLLVCAGMNAEDRMRWLAVEFPNDSPLGVVSYSLGDSTAAVKGISLALDLHTSLTLRNLSDKPIQGLALRVEAQDLTPSGSASVTVPSLNVMPGEVFPVRLDLELLRPFNSGKSEGALVQVTLDGVLFDDLSFYGPDKLQLRRALTVYEKEARRDRSYFRKLMESGQSGKLREEMNFGLPDLRSPQLGFELLRNQQVPANNSRPVPVASVSFRGSPVLVLNGAAKIYRNEVRAGEMGLRNRTMKTVQTIDVGWILRDDRGQGFMAGSLPAKIQIGPVQNAVYQQTGVFRVSRLSGSPILVDGVAVFVNDVQFDNGDVWVPSRSDIAEADLDPALKSAIAKSPEQQKLAEIYRKRGFNALCDELRRSKNEH
jgi:hypothetical protein